VPTALMIHVKTSSLRPGRFYLRQADVIRYAAMPRETQPPIKVTDRTVTDGCHRLAAAKLRGDQTILAVGPDIDPDILAF
jgi:hypothetical protein